MLPLAPLLARFSEESAAVLGGPTRVARLEAGWCGRLLDIFEHAGIPFRELELVPEISEPSEPRQRGWLGCVVAWPDSDPVLFQRIGFLDAFRGLHITLLAARTTARLEEALGLSREAWRRSRVEDRKVRTTDGEIVEQEPVAWTDLVLPERLLGDIRLAIDGFANGRALYEALRISYRRGVLFFGPPGNGKSLLCRAIVTSLGWPCTIFRTRSGDSIGEQLQDAFEVASRVAPAVLLFEDVDSLFENGAHLSTFLNLLDGFGTKAGVLVLATTNHPEKLDPALTSRPSRFDLVFEIADPGRKERARYLESLFGDALLDLGTLVDGTDGMSMAFVKEVFVSTCMRALSRGEARPTADDAAQALERLVQHWRSAKRDFVTARPTGFGPR